MASDLIVPVVEVRNVRIHPNADMLSLCVVLGYQMVIGLMEDTERRSCGSSLLRGLTLKVDSFQRPKA